LYYKS